MLVLSLPPPIYSFLSHASLSFPSPPPPFCLIFPVFCLKGRGKEGGEGGEKVEREGREEGGGRWRGKGERSEEGGCFKFQPPPWVPISPPTHLPVKQTT
jgi:hypothetical protein